MDRFPKMSVKVNERGQGYLVSPLGKTIHPDPFNCNSAFYERESNAEG